MNMLATVVPKSDQLNADDLIGRNLTITVTRVAVSAGADQPVAIYYGEDGERPFKACKSMRRVLIAAWGPDGNAYVGRSMTLYRDAKVKYGGAEVGGIRISHMSHIDKPLTLALTETRANRKPYTVLVLKEGATKPTSKRVAAEQAQEKAPETAKPDTPAQAVTKLARQAETIADGGNLLSIWASQADALEALRGTDGWDGLVREVGAGLKRSLGTDPAAAFVTALRAQTAEHVDALQGLWDNRWAGTLDAMQEEVPATFTALRKHVAAQIARVRGTGAPSNLPMDEHPAERAAEGARVEG